MRDAAPRPTHPTLADHAARAIAVPRRRLPTIVSALSPNRSMSFCSAVPPTYAPVCPTLAAVPEEAEVSIKEAALAVVDGIGFTGPVKFDSTKADGQVADRPNNTNPSSEIPRRCSSLSAMPPPCGLPTCHLPTTLPTTRRSSRRRRRTRS